MSLFVRLDSQQDLTTQFIEVDNQRGIKFGIHCDEESGELIATLCLFAQNNPGQATRYQFNGLANVINEQGKIIGTWDSNALIEALQAEQQREAESEHVQSEYKGLDLEQIKQNGDTGQFTDTPSDIDMADQGLSE